MQYLSIYTHISPSHDVATIGCEFSELQINNRTCNITYWTGRSIKGCTNLTSDGSYSKSIDMALIVLHNDSAICITVTAIIGTTTVVIEGLLDTNDFETNSDVTDFVLSPLIATICSITVVVLILISLISIIAILTSRKKRWWIRPQRQCSDNIYE